MADQHPYGYEERFKFTGKERDVETGYDYFGARYYVSSLQIWLSVDPLSDKYPNISPYAFCNWNPIKYVDEQGDSTRLWVETKGVGHTWITTGEGNKMTVYSYGRYDDLGKDKESFRSLTIKGDGVLLRLTGEDAKLYQTEKIAKTNPISVVLLDISDIQMQEYMDNIFYSTTETPSNEKSQYYHNPNAHVVDTYNLLYNNCTTKSIQAINDLGSSLFKRSTYIPSPNGQGYSLSGFVRFIAPYSLYRFLTINNQ